jgi:hypothetical protein
MYSARLAATDPAPNSMMETVVVLAGAQLRISSRGLEQSGRRILISNFFLLCVYPSVRNTDETPAA